MSERALAPPRPNAVERVLMRCPGQCAVCRAWCKQHVCDECLLRYARPTPRCWTCAARLSPALAGRLEAKCGACLRKPPPLDRTIAALDYGFPWDGLLQHYKFHQAIELRETLLERLNQALGMAGAEAPDWLLPVPLTETRQRERGYNQSYELARTLARHRKLHCDPDLLLRVRNSAQQAQLPLAERAANVRRAFAVNPIRAAELRGSHVVLLDDVMTSGATLFEIARVLRKAGVANVQAWVVARTPDSAVD
ncbi:ComF family protein [Roseateles oligotrophus]|uniref:ComF family protein n=1 Tax=Roseateles oligotrophus TaxID=1769250 RepID=A0ABT2YE42_9BURK|nr:ComF family protein [Roseateles oligotrophus]MCV2368299.1 ComF family protein [Roseateles oligotrophus]